ncbi:uncharacterized protein [Onthophagus taurus]|uniref:uncharacterized protein n=1 Tax=Onthophagus taurus TaxID=166361 RepID=UPI000C207C50|nr:uncharacterized protein LOC111424330 [Onthophagus taurus]
MSFSTFSSLFFLICAVGAYDFEDTVYNQILAEELTDLQWDNHLINPRTKRDEEAVIKEDKCRKKHFRSCCDEEYFSSLREDEKPMRKECYREITGKELAEVFLDPFKCDRGDKHKKDIACVAQCVGRKKGLIDDDGNVNEPTARKIIKEKMSKVDWLKPKSEAIFNKCYTAAKEAAIKQRDKNSCNPAASKLGHCIWKEIQLNCPADRIIDDKKCTKIREDIKRNQNQTHDED